MSQNPRDPHASGQVGYSVEQALQLINTLPLESMNEALVVHVVRTTLENVGVSIPRLLESAAQQQDAITNEIVRLQSEISSLQQAIEQKTSQVTTFQTALVDIGALRERLSR